MTALCIGENVGGQLCLWEGLTQDSVRRLGQGQRMFELVW